MSESIVDTLMNRSGGRAAVSTNPADLLSSMFGSFLQQGGNLPAPNAGIPATKPVAVEQPEDELAGFDWLWKKPTPAPPPHPVGNVTPATVPVPTPAAPEMAKFSIDAFSFFDDNVKPESVGQVYAERLKTGQFNSFAGVNEADMTALLGGDMTKLPIVMNAAIASAVSEAVVAAVTLIGNRMPQALAPQFDRFSAFREKSQADRAIAGDGDGVGAFLMKAVADQYAAKNPHATAAEIKQQAEAFVKALGKKFAASNAKVSPQQHPQDWGTL